MNQERGWYPENQKKKMFPGGGSNQLCQTLLTSKMKTEKRLLYFQQVINDLNESISIWQRKERESQTRIEERIEELRQV